MKLSGHVQPMSLKVCKNFEKNRPLGGEIAFFKCITYCILHNISHIHSKCISYDRSRHAEQLCLKNHCCQSNSLINILHYVKNLLLQINPRFFAQSRSNHCSTILWTL